MEKLKKEKNFLFWGDNLRLGTDKVPVIFEPKENKMFCRSKDYFKPEIHLSNYHETMKIFELKKYKKFNCEVKGVGYWLKNAKYGVLDIDNAFIDDTEKLRTFFQKLVDIANEKKSCIFYSKSKRGLHIPFLITDKESMPFTANKLENYSNIDLETKVVDSKGKKKEPGIDWYSNQPRHVAFTWNVYNSYENITLTNEDYKEAYKEFKNTVKEKKKVNKNTGTKKEYTNTGTKKEDYRSNNNIESYNPKENINKEFINNNCNIDTVLKDFMNYTYEGQKCDCPFHDANSISFERFNLDDNKFICYSSSCNTGKELKSGGQLIDCITVVEYSRNVGFKEAMIILRDKYLPEYIFTFEKKDIKKEDNKKDLNYLWDKEFINKDLKIPTNIQEKFCILKDESHLLFDNKLHRIVTPIFEGDNIIDCCMLGIQSHDIFLNKKLSKNFAADFESKNQIFIVSKMIDLLVLESLGFEGILIPEFKEKDTAHYINSLVDSLSNDKEFCIFSNRFYEKVKNNKKVYKFDTLIYDTLYAFYIEHDNILKQLITDFFINVKKEKNKSNLNDVLSDKSSNNQKRSNRKAKESKEGFIKTHLIDEFLDGGLKKGITVIGAVPSLGKTTLIHQCCENIAKDGVNVLYFALEMSIDSLIDKSISRNIKLNHSKNISTLQMYDNYRTEEEKRIINIEEDKYFDNVANKFKIIEGQKTIEEIQKATKFYKLSLGNDKKLVVVIDYLQFIIDKNSNNDKQKIDKSLAGLKELVDNLEIPIIIISSFNRDNYYKTADQQSFKESGDIEYTADKMVALEYEIVTNFTKQDDDLDKRLKIEIERKKLIKNLTLKLLKNRGGEIGKRAKLIFHANYALFKINKTKEIDEVSKKSLENFHKTQETNNQELEHLFKSVNKECDIKIALSRKKIKITIKDNEDLLVTNDCLREYYKCFNYIKTDIEKIEFSYKAKKSIQSIEFKQIEINNHDFLSDDFIEKNIKELQNTVKFLESLEL